MSDLFPVTSMLQFVSLSPKSREYPGVTFQSEVNARYIQTFHAVERSNFATQLRDHLGAMLHFLAAAIWLMLGECFESEIKIHSLGQAGNLVHRTLTGRIRSNLIFFCAKQYFRQSVHGFLSFDRVSFYSEK